MPVSKNTTAPNGILEATARIMNPPRPCSFVTGQPVTYCENEWPIKSVEGNGFPVLREELVDFRGGVGLDSDEDIFDVFVGVHFVQAAR